MRCQRALTWVRHRVLATDMIGRFISGPDAPLPAITPRPTTSVGTGQKQTQPTVSVSSQHSPPQPLPQMVAHPQGIGDGRE